MPLTEPLIEHALTLRPSGWLSAPGEPPPVIIARGQASFLLAAVLVSVYGEHGVARIGRLHRDSQQQIARC